MKVRPFSIAATLALALLSATVAAQAQDASPDTGGSPVPPDSSPAAQSPAAVESPAEVMPDDSAGDGPHPAHIHAGACPEPGDVVQPLTDLMQPTVEMVGEGAEQVPIELSTTLVPLALGDILAAEHAINVHESEEAIDTYIACGDIGAQLTGEDSVAIVLEEQNTSGHTGFAWLTDQGDGSTRVDIILTRAAEEGTTEDTTEGTGEDAEAPEDTSGDAEGSPEAESSPDAAMTLAPEESAAAG